MALARNDIAKVRGTSDEGSSVVEDNTTTDDASTTDTEASTEEKDANDCNNRCC